PRPARHGHPPRRRRRDAHPRAGPGRRPRRRGRPLPGERDPGGGAVSAAPAAPVELTTASAAELSGLLAAGEASSAEIVQAHLDRIAAVDGDVHAYLHVNAAALDAAAAVDARRAAGEPLSELAGVPV